MKTEAYQIVKRILSGDNDFDSHYTSKSKGFSIMQVKDEDIFNDLTEEEKLELADITNKFPILNIWTHTWVYVLNKWVLISALNTWDTSWSYNPDFVYVKNDYLLNTQDLSLYKRVSQEEPMVEPMVEPEVPLPMLT